MKTDFFKRVKTAAKTTMASVKEHWIIFGLSVLSCIFICLEIYDLDDDFAKGWYDIFLELGLASFMGCVFSMPAALLTQKIKAAWKKYCLQGGIAALGMVVGFFAYRGFGNYIYKDLYYWGILFAAILVTVYIFIPGNFSSGSGEVSVSSKTYFAGLIKHFLFSGLMAGVLFGGLALLYFAFCNLIFDFDDFRVYGCCGTFCLFVFAVNVFVYYLFYKREEESSGKAFKVIFLYILLPVFFLLIALLYLYLFKALILWKLPNGQINWFVSFASCIYIVFYYILREYDELPAVRVFYKYGAFAFIPLICIQIPAYCIRLNAYGFTGWRFSSLLFIIFSIIAISVTFIKKGAFTKYSLLLLSAIILFASVTPWNLINSAHKSQYNRMMKILNKYEMFDKETNTLTFYDKSELNITITEEDREKLHSSFDYLTFKSSIPLPDWMKANQDGKPGFSTLFGIAVHNQEDDDSDKLFSATYYIEHPVNLDISTYSKMTEISEGEMSWGTKDGKYQDYAVELPRATFVLEGSTFDITDFLLEKTSTSKNDDYLWCKLDDKKVLCIVRYDFCWNKERELFRNYSFSGFVFYQ